MVKLNLQFFGGRGASGTMKNANGKVITKKTETKNDSNIRTIGEIVTEQNEEGDEVYQGRKYTVVDRYNGKDVDIIVNEHVSTVGLNKDIEKLAKATNGFSIAYGSDNKIVLDGMEFKPWDSKARTKEVNSTGKSVLLERTYQPDVFVKNHGEFERPILDVVVKETTSKNGDKRYSVHQVMLNGRYIVNKKVR